MAVSGMVSALSNVYARAAGDHDVAPGTNPAAGVASRRRTLTGEEMATVEAAWCNAGDDPELDSWLGNHHLMTGSRRAGALDLRLAAIDVEKQLIYPPDKDSDASRGIYRDAGAMPVPRALVKGLVELASSRGAASHYDHVFRGRDGLPVAARRYDTIKCRCAKVPVVAQMDRFGSHHLRNHAAAQMEDIGGTRIKQRFLRHEPN